MLTFLPTVFGAIAHADQPSRAEVLCTQVPGYQVTRVTPRPLCHVRVYHACPRVFRRTSSAPVPGTRYTTGTRVHG